MDIPGDDEDETLLFNLVYCSRAATGVEIADIRQMVSAAQRKNARLSITGWLVFSDGIFFQWLEGPRGPVTDLMASIKADKRHTTVVVLSEAEEVRARMFSEWDMELVSADEIQAVLIDAIGVSQDGKSTRALRLLLKELESKS